MKVTINMMDLAGVTYSWETIYTALLHNLIEISEVEIYAMRIMESNDYKENDFINNLVWGGMNKEEIKEFILNEHLVSDINSFEEYELMKIKYAILFYLKENYKDSREYLLRKIEEVYSDFGYPENMSDFIYYMPVCNNRVVNKEEAENNLILKFNKYMDKLKNMIIINKN